MPDSVSGPAVRLEGSQTRAVHRFLTADAMPVLVLVDARWSVHSGGASPDVIVVTKLDLGFNLTW